MKRFTTYGLAVAGLLISTFSAALIMPNAPKKEECKIANSQVKHQKDVVEHYSDLIQKVAIRGDDTRMVSDNNASFPLECMTKKNVAIYGGTLNLISEREVVSVMHVFADPQDKCATFYDLDKCYADLGNRKIRLEINKEKLIQQCKEKGDSIVVLEFEKGIQVTDRDKYNVLCSSELSSERNQEIKVRGGFAENAFKNQEVTEKLNPGFNSVEGNGQILRVSKRVGKIFYSNDTGGGTSGGALEVEGRMIGIHQGDYEGIGVGVYVKEYEQVGGGLLFTADNFVGCQK